MADNVPITAGSGTNIATDDAGAGGHVQLVKLAISTDGSATLIPAEASNGLDVDVTRVQGTVTVANGGTFAVQIDGAALTALQLIDDTVLVDDAAFTPATSKVTMVGAEADDTSPDSVDEGDAGALRMSTNRNLYVRVRDNAGNERGLNVDTNGAIASTVTNATATNLKAEVTGATAGSGTATGAIRVELPTNGTGVVGLNAGANTVGNIGTVATSVTPGTSAAHLGKAEDAAAADGDTGVYVLSHRKNTPATTSGSDGDYSGLTTGPTGQLWVAPVLSDNRIWIDVTSSGLTTATTGYTAGDQMGAEMTFANAVRFSGSTGVIDKITLTNRSVQLGGIVAMIFQAASTPAADNAANAWSDANMELCVAALPLTPMLTSANNQVLQWEGYAPIKCAATSLFVNLVTLSTHTFFGTATDMVVRMSVLRD